MQISFDCSARNQQQWQQRNFMAQKTTSTQDREKERENCRARVHTHTHETQTARLKFSISHTLAGLFCYCQHIHNLALVTLKISALLISLTSAHVDFVIQILSQPTSNLSARSHVIYISTISICFVESHSEKVATQLPHPKNNFRVACFLVKK